MNREINFRAYDKEDERMTYFDDEDYLYQYPFILRLEQVFKKDSNYDDYEDFEYKDITNKVELMQYTGLHDKNGKEIYEGDILKSIQWNNIYLVKYIGTAFYLYRKGNNGFNKITTWNNAEKSEIIGNIYDNLELLGGE
jgi:uncharacterized phage protein (TIGR01671 family)|nr:MAG TPA: YopX protein [Caudoviricetes sp.]